MVKLASGTFTNMTRFSEISANLTTVVWPIRVVNVNKIMVSNRNNRSFTILSDGSWEFNDQQKYTDEQIKYYLNLYMPDLVKAGGADGFTQN